MKLNRNNLMFLIGTVEVMRKRLENAKLGSESSVDTEDDLVGLFRISPDNKTLSLLIEKMKAFLNNVNIDFSDIVDEQEGNNNNTKPVSTTNTLDSGDNATSQSDLFIINESGGIVKTKSRHYPSEVTVDNVELFFESFERDFGETISYHLLATLIKWILTKLEEPLLPFDFCTEESDKNETESNNNNNSSNNNNEVEDQEASDRNKNSTLRHHNKCKQTGRVEDIGTLGEELIIKTVFHHLTRRYYQNESNGQIQQNHFPVDVILLILECTTKLVEVFHMISKDERFMMSSYSLFVVLFPPICTSRAKDATKYLILENQVITSLNKRRKSLSAKGQTIPTTKFESLIENGDSFVSYMTGLVDNGNLRRAVIALSSQINRKLSTKSRKSSLKSRWSLFDNFSLQSMFSFPIRRKSSVPRKSSFFQTGVPSTTSATASANASYDMDNKIQVSNVDEFIKRYPSASSPEKNAILSLKRPLQTETPNVRHLQVRKYTLEDAISTEVTIEKDLVPSPMKL